MILKGGSPSLPRRGNCFTASVITFNIILMIISLCMLISYSVILIRGKQYIDLLGHNAGWIVAFLIIFLSSLMIVAAVMGYTGVATGNISALRINCFIFLLLTILVFIGGIVAWHEMWNIIALISYNLKINMGLYKPSSTQDATTTWDDIQRNMKCCGIHRPSDWGKYCPSYKYTLVHKYPESCEHHYVYGDGCMAKLAEWIRLDLWTIGAFVFIFTLYGVVAMAVTSLFIKELQGDKQEYYTGEPKGSPKIETDSERELHPKEREAREGSSSDEPESCSTLPADLAERGSRGSRGSLVEGEEHGPMRHVKRIGGAIAKGYEGSGSQRSSPV